MLLAQTRLEFLLDTICNSEARRKQQPRGLAFERMAFRSHICTTNTRYADIVVGLGTLSSTTKGLDKGMYGFPSNSSVGHEDKAPSQEVD